MSRELGDAVEWATTVPVSDVPWLRARRGKENIVAFFESMAPLEIKRFEPHAIFDGGDKIFVLIASAATALGKRYSFPNNGHLWQFNTAGKVVKFDHVTDTAQMIRIAKGERSFPGAVHRGCPIEKLANHSRQRTLSWLDILG